MNIDRKMVSLFFEIKRNMPYEQREDMKIASPELGAKLVGIYQESDNKSLKRLIEDFMVRAGDSWSAKLDSSKRSNIILSRLEALNPREAFSRKETASSEEALPEKEALPGKESISSKEALRRAKNELARRRSIAH